MFTVNIKAKNDPKNPKLAKLELILYKNGYNRVPRILDYTGFIKDWDHKAQIFTSGKNEAINKKLIDLKLQYKNKAQEWDEEGRNWSPVELARHFDEKEKKTATGIQKGQLVKSMPIENFIDTIIDYNNEKKRIKNGQVVKSNSNANIYKMLKNSLHKFVKNRYDKSFSNYYFTDLTEDFLIDYAIYIKQQTDEDYSKKGAKEKPSYAGLTTKLRRLRATCNRAKKNNIFDGNISFDCVASYLKWPKFNPKAVSKEILKQIENFDRNLLDEKENLYLDLFLFSWFVGGMPNMDVCSLTWDCIDFRKNVVIYERQKINKIAKAPLTKKGKDILKKYKEKGYANFVFPVFEEQHQTTKQKDAREGYFSTNVSILLTKICNTLHIKENITWYTARSSYITMLVDKGYNPYLVGEIVGSSPLTIYRNYYKNTREKEILKDLNDTFE